VSVAVAEPQNAARTRCMLCGQDDAWHTHLSRVLDYLTGEYFDIDRCESCGLMITRPMPTEAQIERYYPPRYRNNRHAFTGSMRVALRARAIESFFPNGFRGRLLDVGCGDGSFVMEMRRRGWDVCATELDPATVHRLQEQGVDARQSQGAFEHPFREPFDAVTCWHVMEHVDRPLQVAEWVHTQLKPAGMFQATVPNARSLQARLFKKQWLHLDVPRHRYHFCPSTFESLLRRARLEPVGRTMFAWEYDWFGAIQSALNDVCGTPNWLFERLTRADVGPSTTTERSHPLDGAVSCLLAGPIALASLPAMLIARLFGDGATLTITARPAK